MDGSIWREGEVLTEAEAERYDELAEGEVLDAEGTTELEALQTKIDGTFTAEQKKVAGVLCYVDRDGKVHAVVMQMPDRLKQQGVGGGGWNKFLGKGHNGRILAAPCTVIAGKDTARPHASRIHLQNMDFRARTLQ